MSTIEPLINRLRKAPGCVYIRWATLDLPYPGGFVRTKVLASPIRVEMRKHDRVFPYVDAEEMHAVAQELRALVPTMPVWRAKIAMGKDALTHCHYVQTGRGSYEMINRAGDRSTSQSCLVGALMRDTCEIHECGQQPLVVSLGAIQPHGRAWEAVLSTHKDVLK